jgi:glucose-fructose oxidoreductase
MTQYTVAGINFAHFHMGDILGIVADNPDTELVAICDEDQESSTLGLQDTADEFGLDDDRVYTDHVACLEEREPDIVVLCPSPADHVEWVEKVAPYGVNVILEKGTALTPDGYDRMIEAMEAGGGTFLTNWPLAWYRSHRTTKRLIDEGTVGEVVEVHYYDGNKGSGRFEKVEFTDAGEMHFAGGDQKDVAAAAETWWHQAEKGGGSLVDYLGYGANLATWFRDGELPVEVTTRTEVPEWSEVDTQSVTVARYEGKGLSKFETRWGTFTDPWVHQPQPKCGFVVTGTEGTISSYDYEETVRVQTAEQPEGYEVEVDELESPIRNQVEYLVHCLDHDVDVEFEPLSPYHCRESNRIVVAARESVERDGPVSVE